MHAERYARNVCLHKPWLRSSKPHGLDQPRSPRRRGKGDGHTGPAGASTRPRSHARRRGQCRMSSLTDRHTCRLLRRERDGDCGRPRRFDLYPPSPHAGGDARAPNAGGDARAPNAGGDARAPNAGGDARVPNAGGDARAPNAGGDARAPNAGGDARAPRVHVVRSGCASL
jgi:hypothetical protein